MKLESLARAAALSAAFAAVAGCEADSKLERLAGRWLASNNKASFVLDAGGKGTFFLRPEGKALGACSAGRTCEEGKCLTQSHSKPAWEEDRCFHECEVDEDCSLGQRCSLPEVSTAVCYPLSDGRYEFGAVPLSVSTDSFGAYILDVEFLFPSGGPSPLCVGCRLDGETLKCPGTATDGVIPECVFDRVPETD